MVYLFVIKQVKELFLNMPNFGKFKKQIAYDILSKDLNFLFLLTFCLKIFTCSHINSKTTSDETPIHFAYSELIILTISLLWDNLEKFFILDDNVIFVNASNRQGEQPLLLDVYYYSSSKGRSRQGTVERLHPDGSGIVVWPCLGIVSM